MATIRYFAYGSNMLQEWLRRHVPSAVVLGSAKLPGYALHFNKLSSDKSGKANIVALEDFIVALEDFSDAVYGVIYKLLEEERPLLDKTEKGYNKLQVTVSTCTGDQSAFTYAAPAEATRHSLKPYIWYKELTVAGAIDRGLPLDYVRRIEAVESKEDPDPNRLIRKAALEILRQHAAAHRIG